MPIGVVALVYALIGLIGARVLVFRITLDELGNRILLSWALLAPISFFLVPGILPFFWAAAVLLLLRPRELSDRVVYFIGVLPALPDYYDYEVPFPGLNYLFELNYYNLLGLLVLLPAVAAWTSRKRPTVGPNRMTAVDMCLLMFVIYISMMTLRDAPITTALRHLIDTLLTLFLPYYAISRLLQTEVTVGKVLNTLHFLAIIMASLTVVCTVFQWDFYRLFDLLYPPVVRNNLVRISTTVNTAALCTVMVTGCILVEYYYARNRTAFIFRWIQRLAFVSSIYVTGNRGGLLQLAIALGVFHMMMKTGPGFRKLVIISSVLAFFGFMVSLQTVDWSAIDEEGTFAYRAALIEASMVQVSDHPLFGEVDYLSSGNFDHLVQSNFGEGFVDVVNYYLEVVLEYGLIGLLLFIFMYAKSLVEVYSRFDDTESEEFRLLIAFLVAMLVSYLAVIATTSNLSLMPLMGMIILALCRSVSRMEIEPAE